VISNLSKLGSYAAACNLEIYIVGGFVRDLILQSPSLNTCFNEDLQVNPLFKDENFSSLAKLDIDLVVNCNALKFLEGFKSETDLIDIESSFEQFYTAKFFFKDSPQQKFEIASARTEVYPKPAAFPKVTLIDSITMDLKRRDFTVNSLLISLLPDNFGCLIDKVAGLQDLERKLVKVFHEQSFIDDPTRIFRALRLCAEYNFNLENQTFKLMKAATKHLDYEKWLKKRKNRFEIERLKIKEKCNYEHSCNQVLFEIFGVDLKS
jgi:tRNA nucleotidyltransferase (CCA-adding enzyme)